ncbi:hypothetical protein XELAEV_18006967mg [Xenopus laevis]|uniref:Uncharacterized protein n=1 Tax=Xenopus laevis TaxID=8355 RepID=A0A974I4K0_XENLA|nr:hypothetical protein XELAEV_18006967mg [Xenopus laevis]
MQDNAYQPKRQHLKQLLFFFGHKKIPSAKELPFCRLVQFKKIGLQIYNILKIKKWKYGLNKLLKHILYMKEAQEQEHEFSDAKHGLPYWSHITKNHLI